ncbi:MAG: glycosyltransferase family 4 protein [Rhizonema sp. PD37]|nr:glycosyltransferase family 4 protein [Rhizonema sp. PD37]
MNKIYFLIGAIPPQTGGELYNYKLSKYLEAEGFEIECISLHKRLEIRLSRIPFFGNLLANVALACWLYKCQGTLVEDHYFTQYLIFTNIIQFFIKRGKTIVLVHFLYGYDTNDNFLIRKYWNKLNHKIRLSLADMIITNSNYSQQEIVSLGINRTSVHVLPPGINREKLKIMPFIDERENCQILCVANYVSRKGLIYLIEAFSQTHRKEFTLHLVGNPQKSINYFHKLEKFVNELNLNKDIFFHDGSDKDLLCQLYSQAKIFVLPSINETFGIVLIEAMYYGLPIITTNVAAIPELITDGENGLLVPPANSSALAEALSKLIENPELRTKMGEMGQKRVANSYYWEQSFGGFIDILQKFDC